MPLKEIAVLGFDRLKVSDVVPFNDTLAAPKTFAITGGKFAGGGGVPDPDEPPPQPVFQSKLSTMPRHSGAECTFLQSVGLVFRPSLLLWSNVRHFIALCLGLNIHLVIQLFNLILSLLDLLKEVHFFLRLIVQLKAPIRGGEPVMRLAIQRIGLDCSPEIVDCLFWFLLHHQNSCQT
jgi:hypothetical protein